MPITDNTGNPPPRSTRANTVTKKAQSNIEKREEAVTGLGQLAQIPLMALKQYADVAAIGIHWPKISHELAVLADSQDAIASVIDPLIKVGPYTALVTAVMPLALQIAVNHGRVPPGPMGTVPAVTLSTQLEAEIARTQAQALKLQAEAVRAAEEIRREITELQESAASE